MKNKLKRRSNMEYRRRGSPLLELQDVPIPLKKTYSKKKIVLPVRH